MKKKISNTEKVVAALDAVDNAVITLEKQAARYNEYIDEAALHGDDAKAKQLIKQKISVTTLREQLGTLKSNIERGVYTSQAISELGKLPAAISGCKGLLAESPDFSKLGKSITSIFTDINNAENDLAKLNEIFSPKPEVTLASRLDGVAPADEATPEFNKEYEAMKERLRHKVAPEAVTNPEADVSATGEIDYAGIISDENNKQ